MRDKVPEIAKDEFFSKLDPAEQRETTINWPGLVQRVVDDYRQHTTLGHGIQKDAIQNAWDARKNRRHATGWGCRFHLHSGQERRYFAITDWGTHGLTGSVLTPDEYFADLPEEERWARFESLAFTHPESDAEGQLGARGQGKFIFVGASSTGRLLYDTLRADGVYRLGLRTLEPTKSPVWCWEGDSARERLLAYDEDLAPLTQVGTRIIIDEPHEELVSAVLSGLLARHIAETWWPILRKFKADISVRVSAADVAPADTQVMASPEFDLPEDDNTRFDVWLKENERIDYQGERFLIKRMHVVRDKRVPVPEDIQGVALFRAGMKVMSLPMKHVPAELSQSVYGFVEFDLPLDEEMKRLESPTHYSFDLGRGVGRKVKNLVEDELTRFATTKLGQGADPRAVEAERHREAERRALAAINRAARKLGIVGKRGAGGGVKGRTGGGPDQPIAAVLIPPVFPRESRRFNHGEELETSAFARSTIDVPAAIRLSLYVTRGDHVVQVLAENDLRLEPKSESSALGPASMVFTADDHETGEYVLRAKATLMHDAGVLRKGHEHRSAYHFWLEQDPPEVGIFDDVEGLNYGDRPTDAEVVPSERGGWKFQYNAYHPAKRREDQSEESLFDYLLRLMARELVYVDLRSGEPTQFTTDELESNDETYRKAARIVSKILFEYYE